jgi:hypothetical protein
MKPPPEVSPAPPDLAPEHLETHAEVTLQPGFMIEDAEVERLGAEGAAGSGRIVHARIASGELGAARLRDLRGSDLRLGGDVAALRGAIVDTGQAIDLAPRMAVSLGLRVIDR